MSTKEKVKTRNKTLQRRSDLCIPRNETSQPCSQFPHSCICERFFYIPKIGPPIFCGIIGGQIVEILIAYKNMKVEIEHEVCSFIYEYLF